MQDQVHFYKHNLTRYIRMTVLQQQIKLYINKIIISTTKLIGHNTILLVTHSTQNEIGKIGIGKSDVSKKQTHKKRKRELQVTKLFC